MKGELKAQEVKDDVLNVISKFAVNVLGKIAELRKFVEDVESRLTPDRGEEIESLREEIRELSVHEEVETIQEQMQDVVSNTIDVEALKEDTDKKIIKVKRELLSRMSGGGQANRNILIGGNSSTLSRYTDINFKAGANVSLSYLNNDNLKTTDITIAGTGGGGGITRSINTLSVSSVLAEVSSTDYVFVASQGILVTLPTAVGNENLYTVKNIAASSVMVATTGGETIDGDPNIILGTQYTSVDLISDNANWHIT